jgi:hypothetical protein
MSRRKTTSGGQALVMVTLALFAMTGIMGLAVDMGWSFFVQKRAQAAADAAALGAAEAAFANVPSGTSVSGFNFCAVQGTCTQGAPQYCGADISAGSLLNGCYYAKSNGFDWNSGNQRITMAAWDGAAGHLPVFPNINGHVTNAPVNMAYWVTAGTVQTVPQLFSVVLGNTQGVVSAVATAAIAGVLSPANFQGMNQRGDCVTETSPKNNVYCGVDVITGTGGNFQCGATTKLTAGLCAPAGIILGSSCNGTGQTGCTDPSSGYAGDATHQPVMGRYLTIMADPALGPVLGPGAVTDSTHWLDMQGNPITATSSENPTIFRDPTSGNPQPPLLATAPPIGANPIGSCGIPGGTIVGGGGTTLGPYQYYSYTTDPKTGLKTPDGNPISISGTVTFGASGCPGVFNGGAPQPSALFPTYIFYGGLNQSGTTTFTAGQYVMAGTKTSGGNVFTATGTIQPDASAISTGTMFVFTDGNYPGLGTPVSTGQPTQLSGLTSIGLDTTNINSLVQGGISVTGAYITLYGLVNSTVGSNLPTVMDAYTGIVWWQDRRNSVVGYSQNLNNYGCINASVCNGDNGSVAYCSLTCVGGTVPAGMITANHTSVTSPGIVISPGNGNLALYGAFYQPRGAWIQLGNSAGGGTSGFTCANNTPCPLQLVTGALDMSAGDTAVILAGPTNAIVTYKPVLIR